MDWLNQLKRESLRKVILRVVLLLALGTAFFVLFGCHKLLGTLSPKTLADLTPETMEGAYVEDDIYFLYTPYVEVEQYRDNVRTGTVGMQYLTDFDEIYYMGLYVHKDSLQEAEALMDASEDFMEGNLAAEQMPVMHVKGTVRLMEEDDQRYYFDLAEGDAELEAVMLPYYLDVGRVGKQTFVTVAVFAAVALICVVLAIFPLVKALTGGYQKQLRRKLSESGDMEAAAERAERFYEAAEPVCGVRMNGEYVFFQEGPNSILLRPWEVAWAYQSTTQHRTNGIPSGKTYAAVLRTMDGKQYTLGMSESQVQTLLGAMETALPGTVLGYSDELAGLYKNNRDFFSQRWEEKAPGCTARRLPATGGVIGGAAGAIRPPPAPCIVDTLENR